MTEAIVTEIEVNVEALNPFQLISLSIPQRNLLPANGAIYFVISKNGELLYIGQTKNLKNRWHKHECCINLESPRETNIAWFIVEDFQCRKEWEALLINKFKPPLNFILIE